MLTRTTVTFALAALVVAVTPAQAALSRDDGAPSLLFVQDAERGTFEPGPKRGQHWLTLHGVPRHVLWFENRPGSRKGTVSPRTMMRGLFKPPVVPPNAAVDAWDPERGTDVVMGVKILGWKWHSKRNVMRYRVRELRDAPGSRRAARVNAVLPRRFGEAAVFIDDQFGRNECLTLLTNKTGDRLTLNRGNTFAEPVGFSRYSYPSSELTGGGYTWAHAFGATWEGCYTRQEYKGPRGTVTLGLDVPYYGSNDWGCGATGSYKCTGPLPGSRPYGDNVEVHYEITMR